MTSRVLRALAYALVSAIFIPAAAFAAASKPAVSPTPVFAPGTVQSVTPVIQKTYGPPCPLKPTILHAVASVSLGRWWIHKQDPQCIHIQRGQRVTVELDSGRTVILDQLALQNLHPGDRIWLDESLWQATPVQP